MTDPTTSQQEDERAFEEMVKAYSLKEFNSDWWQNYVSPYLYKSLRFAWDACIRRGQELRSCCNTCLECKGTGQAIPVEDDIARHEPCGACRGTGRARM